MPGGKLKQERNRFGGKGAENRRKGGEIFDPFFLKRRRQTGPTLKVYPRTNPAVLGFVEGVDTKAPLAAASCNRWNLRVLFINGRRAKLAIHEDDEIAV